MKKLREVMRLKFELNLSNRDIGRMLNISSSTVSQYVNGFKRKGLTWNPSDSMTEEALEERLYPNKHLLLSRTFISPNLEYIHQELKKKGVTLQLLWEEYRAIHQEKAYGRTAYSAPCRSLIPRHVDQP